MPFNPEVAIKAVEKRMSAMEKLVDDVKSLADITKDIAGLTKRVVTLESIVKALGQASVASKGAGAVLTAEALAKADLLTASQVNKLLEDANAKQTAAVTQKIVAQQQEIAKAVSLDGRLKQVEAQIAQAIALAAAK